RRRPRGGSRGAPRRTGPSRGRLVETRPPAAGRAGLRLEPLLVGGPGEFEGACAAMAKAGAQAVIVQTLFDPHRAILIKLANQHRLAYMTGTRETAAVGALVSISANFSLLYERTAYYVDKILKGANPATLPVEQPAKFQVVVNMKRAQALGRTISPTLPAQIDETIE